MPRRAILMLLLLLLTMAVLTPASAQTSDPIYIVQPGDNLSTIAARFDVSLDELMQANGLTDPNVISAGQKLVIPGLEEVTGVLDTEIINFGDSYRSLVRRTQIPAELFRRINRIVSPSEFYVGASMIVPLDEGKEFLSTRLTPGAGESLLELAVKHNTDTWTLAGINSLGGTWDGLPGDTLFTLGPAGGQTSSGLPSAFLSAEIRDLPLKQGGTGVVTVKTAPGTALDGLLVDHRLHFFALEDGTQVALQGVHTLLEPGVYPLRINATLPDGTVQSYEQMILIIAAFYEDITLSVPSETLNPSVTEPENQQVISIVSAITPVRKWEGVFGLPVAEPFCIKDWFGTRRTYLGQGSDVVLNSFHSGVDYGICSETNPYDIYAPAPGTVVFTGPLVVRGNTTIIDHGWGIFSGFWHQEESYVTVGQRVETGDLIGKIGGTGRATGPHLHWEVWVNGVQVDPLDWLVQAYP